SAIKSVGKSVVEMIIAERENHGIFHTMEEFIGRMSNKEVNKRTLENFIKAGALDGLPGNRRQKLLVAPDMIDQKNKDKKNSMEGQISLFDIVGEEHKQDFQITFPKAEEFGKEDLLAFEKETLGIYVSGHPLEAYEGSWRANITAMATDFMVEEETERANVEDGSYVTIGGMITGKTVKTTKNNKMMAFVTLEDLVGSVEVVIFPRDYEKNRAWLIEDAKVFVQGRVSIGEDPVGKLICERLIPFEQIPKQLCIQFADMSAYREKETQVIDCLKLSEGSDTVVIYLAAEKARKVLPANWNVNSSPELLNQLSDLVGEKNIKVMEKTIEKIRKMN
ncbi:MAG: OB-fold nucleic acid binding domain-containing protein, partial [Hungatella sp.]